jgi:hypothetical protein
MLITAKICVCFDFHDHFCPKTPYIFGMKPFLLAGVFCCFVFIGFIFYKKAYGRMKFYDSLILFCNNLKNEIEFALMPLTLMKDIYDNKVITEYLTLIKNKQEIKNDLCDDENLNNFFYNLGRHSVREEKEKIENILGFLSTKKADAAVKVQKALVNFKIFIILGAIAVVLLY